MSNVTRSFKELTMEEQPSAGGKGASLARLYQAGYPVPDGFVILPAAFDDEDLKAEAWPQVQAYLARLRATDRDTALAVRSSALSEDSTQASFAGEFETVLNVHTDEEVRQAIRKVSQSRQSERVRAYSQAKGMASAHEVAVVVQQLVPAEVSGILFTADPVTGRRDQAILTATWGLGESIVGGMVTPDTLSVDKATGRVLDRATAEKQVMTVRLACGTEEQPVPEAKRRAPVLSDEEAAELVRLGAQIEALYGMPMDIEWTRAANGFAIVQARPITALPEPEPPPPGKWKLPKGQYAAMRNNIVELMIDPLTPLFDTLGRAAINASLGRQLDLFLGKGFMPDELIISVNRFAYNNGSVRPAKMLPLLLDTVGISKRMFTGAVERWVDVGRPRYMTTVADWQAKPWREFSTTELLRSSRQVLEAAIDAYGALLSGVIPAAWISEALFTITYNMLIRRRDDPPAPTFLLGFDSAPIQAEKSLYDLATWARDRAGLASYLSSTPAPSLAAQLEPGQVPPGVDSGDWCEWQSRFQAHLQNYGHTIYNLDFASPVPADDPAPLLETCKLFISGQGADPHARQQAAAQRREQATQAMLNRLKGLRLRVFRKFIAPARRYAPLREDGLGDVGFAYPLLRQMLRELGRRLAEGGLIESANDVFWLKQDEVEQAAASLDQDQPLSSLAGLVPQRQAAFRAARRVTPPMMLPQMKIFGVDLMRMGPGRTKGLTGDVLRGVAASPGRVTAPARVLHGPEDFAQMQAGDVLVASITTPAWTPLFARAAAVVTDVGGPLSHGSIVAREYGIPAVLGTDSATKRIRSGQVVAVDGSAGTVTLMKDGESGRQAAVGSRRGV